MLKNDTGSQRFAKPPMANFVLGDERFKEEVTQMLKSMVVPGKSGRPVVRRG